MLASISSLNSLAPGTGDWIDLACLAVLVLAILIGVISGLTRLLASLAAMLLALQGGYWLYPTLSYHLGRLIPAGRHSTLTALVYYLIAVLIGLAVFLLLRMLLHRFFKLLVEQPIDRIFGGLAGLALGLMVLFFIFSIFSLLPADNRTRKLVCESSRTGRVFTPVVNDILEHRPAAIRFESEDNQTKEKKAEIKTGTPKRQPARKPAPKPSTSRQRSRH
ncbi:MAG: CvpA family protein [Lentisphaerae bacterium]|jgi:membrane protein required for colicin V production|nr:CvpA family protein [Lentisphaerota bacterium]